MKQKIQQLLGLTQAQYQEQILNTWISWCASKEANKKSLQKIMSSQRLFNWWQRELEKLETEFLEDIACYGTRIAPRDARLVYRQTIVKIYSRFSKPLIKKAHDA